MILNNSVAPLRQLQQIELDMLLDLDRVCRENGIEYYLCAGSLIGAVRHGGFIPWDDDIDIMMLREHYDRFLELAPEALGERYEVQHATTVENYWSPILKVRLVGDTRFRQKHIAHLTRNNGPLIDVFPVDSVPAKSSRKQKKQSDTIRFCRGILSQKLGIVPANTPAKKLLRLISGFFSVKGLHKRMDKAARRLAKPGNTYVSNLFSYYTDYRDFDIQKETFPASMLGTPVRIPFEGVELPVPADADGVLRSIFGDYMTPPPESERCVKHYF